MKARLIQGSESHHAMCSTVHSLTKRSWDVPHDVYTCVFYSCIMWRLTYRTAITPHSQTCESSYHTSTHTHRVKVFLQVSQRNKHNSALNRRLWLSFRISFFSFLSTSNITGWLGGASGPHVGW